MSVKALIIEGWDTVIADVQEVHDKEKQEFLGYRVKDPYVANLVWEDYEKDATIDGAVGNATEARVDFKYWAPLSDSREYDFVKEYVRVIYEPSPSTLELYFAVLAHHQENFTKEVTVDTAKTVVTMLPEEGAGAPPNAQIGAGAEGISMGNESADPNAFDS